MLRIQWGDHKGKQLRCPASVRPTTALVRKSLWNKLRFSLPGSKGLDLFAGSGVIALEALGQGAATVSSIDISVAHLYALKKNFQLEAWTIVKADARRFCLKEYDWIFADPPYAFWQGEALLPWLEKLTVLATPIYLEVPTFALSKLTPNWKIARYGATALCYSK